MGLFEVLQRNSRLFLNCVSDVPGHMAATRAGESTNSIEFLMLHLIDVRFYLARYLGIEAENPYAERLEAAQGIVDIDQFPPLPEMIREWERISAALEDRFRVITPDTLAKGSRQRFPLSGDTVE